MVEPLSRLAILALALLAAASHAQPDERPSPAWRIIVNPANQVASLDKRFIADVFWRKVTRWPDGTLIRPVDLPASAPARARFSQEVLSRSVSAVKSYWEQVIFSGRGVPPPELDTDAAVVAWVLKHPGAIGYVSAAADIGDARVASVR